MTQLEQLEIFEQYEYKGWLITIGEEYGKDLLYGFAQPLKYANIFSYDDYESYLEDERYSDQLEKKVIEAGIVPSDYFTSEIDNGFYISLYHVVKPLEDTENFLRNDILFRIDTAPKSNLKSNVKEKIYSRSTN